MNEPCTIHKIITSRDCRANSTKLLVRDRANSHSVIIMVKAVQYISRQGLYPGIGLQLTLYQFIKKGDNHLSSNYRPISLTSIVMERIIHCQLVKALESHNLINNYQHGFRGRHSTVSLLLTAIHDWAACLERRHSVHCIFLDLTKAFDSVPHSRILLKLECLGIKGDLLQ